MSEIRILCPNGSGESVWLDVELSEKYTAAVSRIAQIECTHDNATVRSKIKRNGATVVKKQCNDCGKPVGNELKRAEWPEAPEWIVSTTKDESETESQKKKIIDREFFNLAKERQKADYNRYMASQEWKEKRETVLRRAGGICEGCLKANAVHVHHLTYENFGDELLFQLVAICTSCHERVHPGKVKVDNEKDWFETEYAYCAGCRWQSDSECSRFEIDCAEALASTGPCGPNAKGFEKLR